MKKIRPHYIPQSCCGVEYKKLSFTTARRASFDGNTLRLPFTSAACSRASPLGEAQPAPWRDVATAPGLTGAAADSAPSSSAGPLVVVIAVVRVVVAASVVVVVISVIVVIVFVAVIVRGVGVAATPDAAPASRRWWNVRRPVVIVLIIPGSPQTVGINVAS